MHAVAVYPASLHRREALPLPIAFTMPRCAAFMPRNCEIARSEASGSTCFRQIAREIYAYTRTGARAAAFWTSVRSTIVVGRPGRMSVSRTPCRPHAETVRPVAHWPQDTRKGRMWGRLGVEPAPRVFGTPRRSASHSRRFREGSPPGLHADRRSTRQSGQAPRPARFKRRAPACAAAPQRARVQSRRGGRRRRDRRSIWSGRRGLPRAPGKHAGRGRTRSARARPAR
jgi:hypothetical protein